MKKIKCTLICTLIPATILFANLPQEKLSCVEDLTIVNNVDPSDPFVNALIIYIAFPDLDPSWINLPTWTAPVETQIENYFANQSLGSHIVGVETVYRPSPNQGLCYTTNNNSDYYAALIQTGPINLNRDGLAVLTDEIFWKVYNDDPSAFVDIDVVFMNYNCYGSDIFDDNSAWATLGNYTFQHFNGVGSTSTIWNDREIMEWSTAHEYGHILGQYWHHSVGIYCQMGGTSWNHSLGMIPYCSFSRREFDWIDDTKFEEITSNTSNITVEPVNQSGKIYKIVYGSQAYYVENHAGLMYDDVYPGTGILVWHGSASNITYYDKDPECADGRWDWQTITCEGQNGIFIYPFVQASPNPTSGDDELDMNYLVACWDGVLHDGYDGNYKLSHPDMKGDSEDFYQIGGNTLFANWTNPNSKNWGGTFTDISVELVAQNGNNIVINILTDSPPKIPDNFRITGRRGEHPTLRWNANNEPDLQGYKIYRKSDGQNQFFHIATVSQPTISYTDNQVTISRFGPGIATYHITAIDNNQNESDPTYDRWVSYNNLWKILSENLIIPAEYALYTAYPNPFNPITTLRYDLPERSNVTMIIYDALGREITTLIHNTVEPGFQEIRWDGTDNNGSPVSTGMYICQFSAFSQESEKQFARSQKMVLMK